MRSPLLRLLVSGLAFTSAAAGCASSGGPDRSVGPRPEPAASARSAPSVPGLLIMAHGGSAEWDAAVGDAVVPLRDELPTALALGMADPTTLQAALDSLADRGVTDVAVVRLFLSGTSFLHQTEFLLGLRADPPEHPMLHGGGHGAHQLAPLRHGMRILIGLEGMSAAAEVPGIVADRALTTAPERGRPVLLLAHGVGDDGENAALIDDMERAADTLRALGFRGVRTATLREDWPEERAMAEAEIRAWIGDRARTGATPIVVPYRLFGFGPYAQVLEGLDHQPTAGLLPHPRVTGWIRSSGSALFCAEGLTSSLGTCAVAEVQAGR